MEATAESPETTESPAFEETVLALLAQVADQVKSLGERVEAVEHSNAPRFIDPRLDAQIQAQNRTRQALTADPDGIPRSQTLPIFSTGELVPQVVMKQFRPKFAAGALVMLNEAAVPFGRDDGQTWGELLAAKNVPNGVGEVFDRMYLMDDGIWKVKVRFPRRTMPGTNDGMRVIRESELVAV